jgi:hypothetical protein
MDNDKAQKLARVQFIKDSLIGLVRIAKSDQFEMLNYLLEMTLRESTDLEKRLQETTE